MNNWTVKGLRVGAKKRAATKRTCEKRDGDEIGGDGKVAEKVRDEMVAQKSHGLQKWLHI